MAEAMITTVELRTRVNLRPYRSMRKPVNKFPTICIGEFRLTERAELEHEMQGGGDLLNHVAWSLVMTSPESL